MELNKILIAALLFGSLGMSLNMGNMIQDGTFETTFNDTNNTYWDNMPYPYPSAYFINSSDTFSALLISGNWSGYINDGAIRQNISMINASVAGIKLNLSGIMHIAGSNGGGCYSHGIRILLAAINATDDTSPNNTEECQQLAGTYPFSIGLLTPPSTTGAYVRFYDASSSPYYDLYGSIDNLTLTADALHTPVATNAGTAFSFRVQTYPDTSAGFTLYANLTCAMSPNNPVMTNIPLSYDVVSHQWIGSKALTNCSGSYNATFYGSLNGLEIIPTASALRSSAQIGYNLTASHSDWASGLFISLNLSFYDTYNISTDITSIISKTAGNLLNTTQAYIRDPNFINHGIFFFYDSATNKFRANFSVPYISCGSVPCIWLSQYLPNITGIHATGYVNLDIKPNATLPVNTTANGNWEAVSFAAVYDYWIGMGSQRGSTGVCSKNVYWGNNPYLINFNPCISFYDQGYPSGRMLYAFWGFNVNNNGLQGIGTKYTEQIKNGVSGGDIYANASVEIVYSAPSPNVCYLKTGGLTDYDLYGGIGGLAHEYSVYLQLADGSAVLSQYNPILYSGSQFYCISPQNLTIELQITTPSAYSIYDFIIPIGCAFNRTAWNQSTIDCTRLINETNDAAYIYGGSNYTSPIIPLVSCGNGICDSGETIASCSTDCPALTAGDWWMIIYDPAFQGLIIVMGAGVVGFFILGGIGALVGLLMGLYAAFALHLIPLYWIAFVVIAVALFFALFMRSIATGNLNQGNMGGG